MVKNLPANAEDTRDMDSIPESGKSSAGTNSNPLQYSCLENPMDRGAWLVKVHGGTKSCPRLKWLRMHNTYTLFGYLHNKQRLGLLWCWMVCLGSKWRSFCLFWDCILDSFVDHEGYSISSKGFLPTLVDIIVIRIKFAHSHIF